MSTVDLLLYGQLAASAVMIVGWVIALLIKNTSYVDVLWAYGVGVLGVAFLVIQSDQCHPARLAVLEGILAVWSLRLGTHLLRRCWGKPEDARYAYLREYLGKKAEPGIFYLFSRCRPSGLFSLHPPF
jgi:steroid 5-alpha reductase family enzyme